MKKKIFIILLKTLFLISISILFLLVFTLFLIPNIIDFTSSRFDEDVKLIATEITRNSTSEKEKVLTIMKWEEENIDKLGNHICIYNILCIKKEMPPRICIRIVGYKNPSWIIFSRCGACMEYSLIFRELANSVNVTVRSVHNPGEDHNWDEVFINGSWLVVDPSIPRFNISTNFYETKWNKNISYVFAIYPNGTQEDITERYTNTSNLTVNVLNSEKIPISDAEVEFLSNNYKWRRRTTLTCLTNNDGKCTVTLGGGNYTIVARKNFFEFDEINILLKENNNTEINLYPKLNIHKILLKNEIRTVITIILLCCSMFLIRK